MNDELGSPVCGTEGITQIPPIMLLLPKILFVLPLVLCAITVGFCVPSSGNTSTNEDVDDIPDLSVDCGRNKDLSSDSFDTYSD